MPRIIYSDNDNLSRALYKKLSKQPKIYGKLSENAAGIPAMYCGELHVALAEALSYSDYAHITDGFVFVSTGDGIARQTGPGVYYDYEAGEFKLVVNTKSLPEYYRALWAIQDAEYAADGSIVGDGMTFFISGADGSFIEDSAGLRFINEDGYLIKGTAENGKLASLSLGEKVESTIGIPVVSLESLLPLVGELPLGTTEIW